MITPVSEKNRIWVLDSIRGVAILGILWVNMSMRTDPVQIIAMQQPNEWLNWLIIFTGERKFRALFAFLFGFGFALQFRRSQEKNNLFFVDTYVRRLELLLLFGVFHIVFWWIGDILAMYAVLGFILLKFRKIKSDFILLISAICFIIPIFIELLGISFVNKDTLAQDIKSAYLVYGYGSFFEITIKRIYDFYSFYFWSLLMSAPRVFAMMLLGVYFERKGFLYKIKENLIFWKKLMIWGLIIGVPGNMVYAFYRINPEPAELFKFIAKVGHVFGAPALCFAYLAILAILSQMEWIKNFLKSIGAIGRMSLTSYLLHSFICVFVFYGYGLGFFGQVNIFQSVGLTFAIFMAQIVFSNMWFRHFLFGPLDWLWRWGTYQKKPPFRRRSERIGTNYELPAGVA
ncbi:MAG: DUF418 domain-containing protein [Desulfobacterales bacterium]|nr:DUF418 domain-containing protein [Desulfobacterales bacterium]